MILFYVSIALIIGVLIGIMIGKSLLTNDGLFIMDNSVQNTTFYKIDLHVDLNKIPQKKILCLKVCNYIEEGDV